MNYLYFIIVLFLSYYDSIFNYFISIAINGGNVIFKNLYDLMSFFNTIIFYSFISNWSSTFLLSVLPIIPKINLPSKNNNDPVHSNKKNTPNSKLNSFFITGFMDGEGCFAINIYKATFPIGWSVGLIFMLVAKNNPANFTMFEEIKNFFGVGNVKVEKNGVSNYIIRSIKLINKFIEKFEETQLLGAKALDYAYFCKAVWLMNNKSHLTPVGLAEFKAITAGMNSTRIFFGADSNSPEGKFKEI
jgi:LAGLIDADG endonuclease